MDGAGQMWLSVCSVSYSHPASVFVPHTETDEVMHSLQVTLLLIVE